MFLSLYGLICLSSNLWSPVFLLQHCVDNMEYVLNIGAIPNELVCDLENLGVWLSCLQILQVRTLLLSRSWILV